MTSRARNFTVSAGQVLYLQAPFSRPTTHNTAAISAESAKTVIGEGFSGKVTVLVADRGDYAEAFNVTAYANDTVIGTQQVSLNETDHTILTFTWNTTGFAYGNYTISAYAWPVKDETNTSDNTFTDGTIILTHMGDINGDGKVDISDLARVSAGFGSLRINDPQDPRYGEYWHPVQCVTCPHTPNADINGDGKIDIQDLARTSGNFGWHQP